MSTRDLHTQPQPSCLHPSFPESSPPPKCPGFGSLLPDSFTSEFLPFYSTLLFFLMQEAVEPYGHLLKESAGLLLQDVITGAAACLNSALQYCIEKQTRPACLCFEFLQTQAGSFVITLRNSTSVHQQNTPYGHSSVIHSGHSFS